MKYFLFSTLSPVRSHGSIGVPTFQPDLRMCLIAAEDAKRLLDALETGAGDLKLTFNDGRSITVHGVKLKLASLGGCLHSAVDMLDDQAVTTKRKRTDEGGLHDDEIPRLKVTKS